MDKTTPTKLDPAEPVVLPAILPCPFSRVLEVRHEPVRLLKMDHSVAALGEHCWVHCTCGASGPQAATEEEAIVAWNKAKR